MDHPSSATAQRKPVVVVIDDDPGVLHSLERELRREPWEILFTSRPGDVLRLLCERPIDLILTDQRMPEIEGTDLLGYIQDCSPATACLILSGFPDTAQHWVDRSGLRIDRLLAKPWDREELLDSLRHSLRRRRMAASGTRPAAPSVPATVPARAEDSIGCAGRTARDVLQEFLVLSIRAWARGDQPRIVLRDVQLLADSVVRLLKGLARAAAESPSPVVVRDDSGSLGAFASIAARISTESPPPG